MTRPVKSWLSINDQVQLLRSRGMDVADPAVAARWLSAVGYYRLSGYWYPYRQLDPAVAGKRLSAFEPGTTFDEITALYEFDRHLKALLHSGLERVEVALRSQIGHCLGAIDPMAHTDPIHFRPTFDHTNWLRTAHRRVDRARGRDQFVDHHDANYGGQLPIWVLTDVLDFSDLSKLYAGLRAADQKAIAEYFAVTVAPGASQSSRQRWARNPPLVNWLEHLTIARNICAHHGRLWNRVLSPIGTAPRIRHLPVFDALPEGQNQIERVYGTISVTAYLLDTASPGHTWRDKVDSLICTWFGRLSLRSTGEMGYPPQ
ncbi:Abi family protein [Mycolicibacterium fortuitum]|uniref:Abi family protein n=2 Tax=Mycolicibacterium fortuitum TaxID=1766 RepID=A0AAE4VEY9_MYCFO|nr:Abi family protein [Mycolicibacterium fortuitum]MCV7138349.1 Abi family protein [Mycolicibacterium fortuitum]MDV7193645.1 Abi family protein [Mycolicibacterium fortuitum]MDV7207054.1 Abi family protein [Mycolicibacterium fortuitum]MDV7228565.1 Abi family protein [Mycolicibacterium fortuitum]MDV7260671.1 Abi family protein [Mycolicibacterium fortuitum]